MTDSKKRLLIIDDDVEFCSVLKARFEGFGFDVQVSYEGSEGLEEAVRFVPDCILLDAHIPAGDNGLTFLKRLRGYRHDNHDIQGQIRTIPVIVLTGMHQEVKGLFEQEQISGFFEKPYDPDQLKAKVLEVVNA